MAWKKLFLYSGTALGGPGALAFGVAQANPQGGQISAGAASIQNQGATLAVRQHTDRAVIDWKSFDISPAETTVFHQPSASSAVLNRIHDHDPSRIEGSLRANGQVFLVNPNGMVFGKGARVNVGSLVASTADIGNREFMQGGALAFDRPGSPHAAIHNAGTITVREAGLAALVAPQVSNSGTILAKLGNVTLASGDTATLDLYGDGLVSVAASESLKSQAVRQAGTIRAQGGEILLQAAQAKQAIDSVVNMTGIADASSAVSEGGSIVLTGDTVRVGAGALVDASGRTGGGDIRIGGDYLGQGETPHAQRVKVERGAHIRANATDKGNGGKVILWSDGRTDFHGVIGAKGGAQGGNGGFVETSSKNTLNLSGKVDASAPKGNGGQWLLDPNDVTIQAGGADTNVTASPNFSTTNDTAIVTTGSIETALNGGTSVTVATTSSGANTQSGDITLNDPIAKTAGGNATLTLQADNSIFINDPITSASGTLGVTLHADKDNSGAGRVAIANATIDTNGGNLTIGGGADPALNPAVGAAANEDGVTVNNSTLTTGAGNISIRGKGRDDAASTTQHGIYLHVGSRLQTTGGNISLNGTSGNGTSNNYGVLISDAGTLITSVNGDISIIGQGNGSADSNYGIYVLSDADITSTGTGNDASVITLNGTGGNGTSANYGIRLNNTGSLVTSMDGDILLTGRGGDGSSSNNRGIYLSSGAHVASTGTGADASAITLTGTGGDGTSGNYGIVLTDAGTLVTSVDGDISLTGTGGNGSAGSNSGIILLSDADITSTGTGANAATITLNGTGGNGTTTNNGVRIQNIGTLVTSVDGDISITGTGAAGASNTNNDGIRLDTDPNILTTGNADIAFTGIAGANGNSEDIQTSTGAIIIGGGAAAGDITLNMNTQNLANLSLQTTGDITLQPRTSGTPVGVAGGAGTLDLRAVVLGMMNWGDTLFLGRADGTGAVTVNTYNWAGENVHLRSGSGAITVNGAQTNLGDFTLTTNADPVLNAGITGTGDLLLQTSSAAMTVGLGGAAGTVNFSAAELGQFGSGWTSWQVGNTATTGTLSLGANTWSDPVTFRAAPAGNIAVTGNQTIAAASDASFTFDGPVSLGAVIDTAAAGAARNVTFDDPVLLIANAGISAGAGDITFNATLNGTHDLALTTTGDIDFGDAVGGGTVLRDVTLTGGAAVTAADDFRARDFTLTGGTGAVDFRAGDGLIATGDIEITTNGNILGRYAGVNGVLDAGAGSIAATVSFTALDIDGASAALLGGFIGAPGTASQEMANLISIGEVSYPNLNSSAAYTYEGFHIGQGLPGSGGSGSLPPVPQTPVEPPVVSEPPPVPETPVVSGPPLPTTPVISGPSTPLAIQNAVTRIERSAQTQVQAPKIARHGLTSQQNASMNITYTDALLEELDCLGEHRHASCGALR